MFQHQADQEPMTLGSPPHSPAPMSPVSPGAQLYLPQYLLGDPALDQHSQSSSRLWSTPSNSSRTERISSARATGSLHSARGAGAHDSAARARDAMSSRPKEKTGAPPVASLFSAAAMSPLVAGHVGHDNSLLTSTPARGGLNTTGFDGQRGRGTGDVSFVAPAHSPPSPPQMDPFYTQGDNLHSQDKLDVTWVTIFGFPASAASYVLQEFSQYGTVVKHVMSPEGNWMHVQYGSTLQAKKALSKSGKVFRNVMVGVSACIDQGVMKSSLSMSRLASTPLRKLSSEDPERSMLDQSSLNSSRLNSSHRLAGVRPLTAAYRAAAAENQVLTNADTPKKSSGLVSKAMEYVFGW